MLKCMVNPDEAGVNEITNHWHFSYGANEITNEAIAESRVSIWYWRKVKEHDPENYTLKDNKRQRNKQIMN